MPNEKMIDAFIVRDFNNAGTETRFTGNTIVPIPEGEFLNHQHAGLVRLPTDDEKKAAKAASGGDETKVETKGATKP